MTRTHPPSDGSDSRAPWSERDGDINSPGALFYHPQSFQPPGQGPVTATKTHEPFSGLSRGDSTLQGVSARSAGPARCFGGPLSPHWVGHPQHFTSKAHDLPPACPWSPTFSTKDILSYLHFSYQTKLQALETSGNLDAWKTNSDVPGSPRPWHDRPLSVQTF